MMKLKVLSILIFALFFSVACVQEKVGNTTEIKTAGVRARTEEFVILGGANRGEFLLGAPAVTITAQVTNTSSYSFKNLSLDINVKSTAGVKFAPNSNGVSGSPGMGGTCKLELAAGETCTYILQFTPTNMGLLSQEVTLSYINLVEPVKKKVNLSFMVGDYSNIIEVNEKIRHDFGTIERMDQDTLHSKTIEIQNVGGLTARNLTFELSNLVVGAYSITANTCPVNLLSKQKCEITVSVQPQNYLVNDLPRTYTTDLTIDYLKNPVHELVPEKGRFGYSFSVYSAKVEGVLAVQGVSGFAFPKLVHGNKAEVEFKLKNNGIKDLILRKILVYNSAGVHQATCERKDASGFVECRDLSNNLTNLMSFPFGFKDVDNCLVDFGSGDYDRDPNTGEFLGFTPSVIAHPTETTPSGICTFKMSFHSSINHATNINFNNWVVGFEYDSTFKNTKEIITTTASLGARLTATMAEAIMGSRLKVLRYTLNTTNFSNPAAPYVFNAGKIALLQSTSTYKDLVKFALQNEVTSAPVKLKSIVTETDTAGTNFVFNNTARTVNPYFTSTMLSTNCKINIAYTTNICELVTYFSPKMPKEISKINGPTAVSLGDDKRLFRVTYNNGCAINDDGTPCADKVLDMWFKTDVVERGSLQYNTAKSGGGSGALPMKYNIGSTTLVSGRPLVGSETWYYLWLDNIGTGAIPYLKTMTGSSFKSNGAAPFPFYIVPDNTSLAVDESDCYNYLRGTPDLNDDNATAVTTPVSFAAPTKCRVKVESMIYPNEKITSYGTLEWRREFYVGRAENREYIYQAGRNEYLGFEFFDGDLSYESDPVKPSNYVTNFGLRTTILGGVSGRFLFKSLFAYPGKIIPNVPTPLISSVLYRPGFTLPAVAKHANSQMAALGAQTIAGHVFNLETFAGSAQSYSVTGNNINMPVGAKYTGLPAVGTRESFGRLNAIVPFSGHAGYDYVYYAGAFPVSTTQEHLGGFTLTNFGQGIVSSLAASLTCDNAPQGCGVTANTIRSNGQPILNSLPALTGNTIVGFKLTPTSILDVGLHEATLTLTFKTPLDQTLRIKILFEVYNDSAKALQIVTTDYECNFGVDPNCNTPTASFAPQNITNQFLYNQLPNTSTKLIAVSGSPIGARKKIEITNTGTESITDVKVFFKTSMSSPKAIFVDPLGYKITPTPVEQVNPAATNQYQCQSSGQTGILLPGDSCTLNITFQPISANNLPVVLAVGYRVLDGAGIMKGSYINKYLDLYFVGDNQANLVIDTQTPKTFSYSGPSSVQSYAMKFGNFVASNHPVLTVFPKTSFDSVGLITSPPLELFNQRSEKASLLKQYELYAAANALPMTPPVQPWTRIYQSGDGERALEANQGCFYGKDYSDAGVPADKKGFYSNDQGTSFGCKIRLVYTVGIDKKGTVDSKNTIIPVQYYSSRRLTTKTIYLHIEGFVEPFRSQNATDVIKDVQVADTGELAFSWDAFTDETASYGDIHRYRIYYSKFAGDLVKIYDSSLPNTLMYADTAGLTPEIYINNLEAGRYYYFQVVAMRRTNLGDPATEYTSMPNSLYRKKMLVPPVGYGFHYATENLIEKSLFPLSGDTVTKGEAQTSCSGKSVILKDESVQISKTLELLSATVYDNIVMSEEDTLINNSGNPSNLLYSDHNFLEAKTWLNDVQDITPVFTPAYDCSQAVGFNADNTASYIKSCDNNNPATLCCNVNTLNQIRGLPLPSSPTIHTLFSNLSGVKAQYRCFVKVSL